MSTKPKATSFQLGPVTVTNQADAPTRMAILLWGPATCGKTTLAATAPGTKLWLSFGDQEHVSIMHRKDVLVANLSELTHDELFKHAQSDNPFGLDKILSERNEIETVVCDSTTAIAFRALQRAIAQGIGGSKAFKPSIEAPGIAAYGARNGIVLEVITGLLRVTSKHGVHIIFTAHEDDPKEKDNIVDYITIMLGGKLVNNMSWRLSEIWYMSQETQGQKNRRIAIRPTRLRRPMKTRMFSDMGDPEFALTYDANKPDKGQMTIAGWYDQWRDKGEKVPVPGIKKPKS